MPDSNQPIVHFTSVHRRHDVRILFKQITTLAKNLDNPVSLYVQDGLGNEVVDSGQIQIIDLGKSTNNRLYRMTIGTWIMGLAVLMARPKVAHFHDPELIPIGIILRISGVKVIYDVHEDVPHQILSKHWIPIPFRRPISWAVSVLEWLAGIFFSSIITTTPTIAARFPEHKTIVVHNFPVLSEFNEDHTVSYLNRPPHVTYVGGVTKSRGAIEMIKAIRKVSLVDIRLKLAGVVMPSGFQQTLELTPGWERVDQSGWLDRRSISQLLRQSRVGLVLLHPVGGYVNAYPVKLFEYMAAGLPVVVSSFPLWREIVEGNQCGLTVNPLNPIEIAEAVTYLLEHPEEAKQLGENGKKAVHDKYNWQGEEEKLLKLYRELLES